MNGDLAAALAARIVDPVLAVVFPAPCPHCGSLVEHPLRGPLCEACWGALPRHRGALCSCGLPLPGAEATATCGRCRRQLSPFGAGFSLGPYEGGLKAVIHELKFRGRRRVAERLAERIAASPGCARVLTSEAVLVPVPLHPRRRRERGFNQSELLAKALARRHHLAVAPDAVVRRKETAPQTGLSAAARRSNVAGAFAVRRRSRVAGRVVVLVDDVVTTGATARACARVLRDAGAVEVRLLTAARVN
jgi:ComF family protein